MLARVCLFPLSYEGSINPLFTWHFISHWILSVKRHKTPQFSSVQFSRSVLSDSCDHTGCSPPGSSARGILQASILEWVAISLSRASSQPRDQTCIFYIAGGFFTTWAIREFLLYSKVAQLYVYIFSIFFSITVYQRILNIVPCAIQ